MKSKKNKITSVRAKKQTKSKTVPKKRQTKKKKKIIGGYIGETVVKGLSDYMQKTYEGTQQSYRNVKAAYEIKKLYDTEEGQYVLEQLGRINYERYPKAVLKELINQALPSNDETSIPSNEETSIPSNGETSIYEKKFTEEHIEKIGKVLSSYEEINLDAFKNFEANRDHLIAFFENFLKLLEDEKYISALQDYRKTSKVKVKKRKNKRKSKTESNMSSSKKTESNI